MTEKNNIWDKFDKAIDTEGLAADVTEAAENGTNFREVPHGDYEVEIKKMELIASKKGDPMVTIWFKIVDGDNKGSMIFMNQLVTQGFHVHIVNEILRAMCEGVVGPVDIQFKNYRQYGELLMDIHEILDGKYEFALEYGENAKGYNTYTIKEVFVVE